MPGDLASLADESGGQVLVVASTASAPSGWRCEAAVSLARAWARRVGRFFLVDLSLEEPCLHDPLEMDNQEGISDVVLYGSAVQRVAQPADDGAFFFASVGTPTSDVEAVLTHERWDGLLKGFGEASATLCAYLPADLPGAESMLQRAHRIVVLGDGASGPVFEAAGDRVVAVLAPPGAEVAALDGVDAEVVDVEELAPEEKEVAAEPAEAAGVEVVDIGDLAPGPAEPEIAAVDIADLAPDEGEEEELAEEEMSAVPRERGGPEEVAEEQGAREEALDESVSFDSEMVTDANAGARAPEADAEAPPEADVEAGVVEVEDLAPEPSEPGTDVVDIGELAPEEPEEEEGEPETLAGDAPGELFEEEPQERAAEEDAPDEVAGEEGAAFEPGPTEEALEESVSFDREMEEMAADLDVDERAGEGPEEAAAAEREAWSEDTGSEDAEDAGLEIGTDFDSEPVRREEEEGFQGFGGLEEEPEEAPTREEDAVDEGEEDYGAFDMGSFDTLGADDEGIEDVASLEDEVRIRSDFGGDDDGEGDPAPDVSDTEFEDGKAGMETVGEDAAGPAGEDLEDEDHGGSLDFGDDLVTGPDFGQGTPDEDWTEEEDEDDDLQDPGEVALPEELPEELTSSGPVSEGGEEGTSRREEGGGGAASLNGRGPRRWLGQAARVVVLLVVAAGAAAGAHWFDLVRIPGFDGVLVRTLGPMAVATAPEVQVGDPVPETPVLDYSLTMDAYRSLDAAAEVARAWEESFDGYVFAVVPVQVEGDAFYRLLAGPATTSETAEALRSSLSELLTREDPTTWVVRRTPLAFLLSEHESAEAARGEARRLRGEGVPAYVLEVEYPGATVRYRVYSGAFESGQEARLLQGVLTEHGHDGARFTERRGRLPE